MCFDICLEDALTGIAVAYVKRQNTSVAPEGYDFRCDRISLRKPGTAVHDKVIAVASQPERNCAANAAA
jgi:hypothetical protein